tara:strand:+ start:2947 stop:4296 length:1350 start_codon:yes stop_codon:yes gene_type:complete
MCDIWIEKYKPKNIYEVISNKELIEDLSDKIKNFKTNNYSNYVVSGYHGVGKNIITKLVLQNNNYVIKYLNYKDEKVTELFDDLVNYCKGEKIDNLFCKNSKLFALIINDIEKITLKNEKNRIKDLVKMNSEEKLFPIFFISNIQHNKLILDILQYSYNIKIQQPKKKELLKLIDKIIDSENILINDKDIKIKIIDFCQYDIRRLITILYDLKNSFNDNEINLNDIDKYIDSSYKKLKDISLFEASKYLIDSYDNIESCLSYYKVDKVLVPLTIHENYSKSLFKKYQDKSILINAFKNVSDSISIGDVIETNIYTDQNWFLHDIHGFYTCSNTSYNINSFSSKNKQINYSYEMKFSSDLNQTSLKNINRKQITNLQKMLPYKNVNDIVNLNKIIYHLVNLEENEKIYNIVKDYTNSYRLVENIIKIDKTLPKISISQRNKKILNNYIKN